MSGPVGGAGCGGAEAVDAGAGDACGLLSVRMAYRKMMIAAPPIAMPAQGISLFADDPDGFFSFGTGRGAWLADAPPVGHSTEAPHDGHDELPQGRIALQCEHRIFGFIQSSLSSGSR
jgi:hypothetical protein